MKREAAAHVRRAGLMQALTTQAGLTLVLVVMMFFSRNDRQSMLLYAATLIVPAGLAWTFWTAYKEEGELFAKGEWSGETRKAGRRRVIARVVAVFAIWVALALAIVLLV